jgi:arginine deiminase
MTQPYGGDPVLNAKIVRLRGEIAGLQEQVKQAQTACDSICDSYAKENQQFSDHIDRLRAALVSLKCHLYAQSAMTDGEIIVACREIARKALAEQEDEPVKPKPYVPFWW